MVVSIPRSLWRWGEVFDVQLGCLFVEVGSVPLVPVLRATVVLPLLVIDGRFVSSGDGSPATRRDGCHGGGCHRRSTLKVLVVRPRCQQY